MADSQPERRRYFRVSDLIGISYRFLSEGERELAVQTQPTSLKSLLGQIENQINVSLLSLKTTNPQVYQLLDLYNQKINLAFGHGFADQEQEPVQSAQACQVSLSACGIAFPCNDHASLNQNMEIELTIYPDNLRLQLLAAVISCDEYQDEADQNPYLIRADFINISDTDQEILVQHVIKRQAQQLSKRREQ